MDRCVPLSSEASFKEVHMTAVAKPELKAILDRAHSFVAEYMVKFGKEPKLFFLSQKYNNTFRRFGLDAKSALSSDLRFRLTLSPRGAYTVSIVGYSILEQLVLDRLESEGTQPVERLRAQLMGKGYSQGQCSEAMQSLFENRMISLKDGVVALVVG
jgi:hypothetical protein